MSTYRIEFTTVTGDRFVEGGTYDGDTSRRTAQLWRERIWLGELGMSRDDGTVVELQSVRVVHGPTRALP